MAKYRSNHAGTPARGLGELDGLFRGLGNVLKAAADLVDKTDAAELSHAGSIGNSDGMRGRYGFSVRVGPAPRSAFPKPATLRTEPVASPQDGLREPPVDLFDEGTHYVIVAEFLGLQDSEVQWHVNSKLVKIEALAENRHYYKELDLPSPVEQQSGTATCKNGILELKLWKQ